MNKEYTIDLNINNQKFNQGLEEVKEQLEEIVELSEEIDLPYMQPIINFYGCSFNFANEGCAEARYYNGDDVYNPRKEDS